MESHAISKIDFLNLSPYVRFVHQVETSKGFSIPPRIIYDHELVFVTKGTCHFTIEDQSYTLREGDMQYMRPFIEHAMHVPKGEAFHCFAVHFDLVYLGESLDFSPEDVYLNANRSAALLAEDMLPHRPLAELGEVSIPYVFSTRDMHLYVQYFHELLALFQQRAYGHHLLMRSCMLKIICQIASELSAGEGIGEKHPHRDKIAEIIRYMYDNYQEEIDLNSIGQSFMLSPKYFRALFKQATGKSMVEYLTHIRIEEAKKLLLENKYTVHEIAAMVGYEDIYYFSKLFKKVEGLSPRNYADSLNGKFI